MTLPAQHYSVPAPASFSASTARGFVELDEHLSSATGGIVIVRASTRSSAIAIGAHAARRVHSMGHVVIHARRGAYPLWRSVAQQLGLSALSADPARCADEIAQACASRRAAIVAPLPSSDSWDRAVLHELTSLANAPICILVADTNDSAVELSVDSFDIAPQVDAAAMQRWWAAVADEAHCQFAVDDFAEAEGWWSRARRVSLDGAAFAELAPEASALLASLALAGRAWPLARLCMFGERATLEALVDAGAVSVARGFVSVQPLWEERAARLAADASAHAVLAVAHALVPSEDDAWTQAYAAELLLRAGAFEEADTLHGSAITRIDDALARSEVLRKWMRSVSDLPRDAQLPLRIRATQRALLAGEADEAYRWAQTLTAIAPEDVTVTLLFGRAAVALGDLVAAKVALERGRGLVKDEDNAAMIAAELAEVAYFMGDLAISADEATRALASTSSATRLKARNTIGKVLLAEARWDEADRHFAEDAHVAGAAGLVTEELRARLNRGIALLSKGMAEQAQSIFESVLVEGERIGDLRACAFALDNLSTTATLRADYAMALSLSERTLKVRRRLGDRLTMAITLANVAELRRKLGLLEHAEHAIAFGRRALGPGMPPSRAARFSIVAARVALARRNTSDARREIARAIADFEAAGMSEYVGEAHRVSVRIALDDGDRARAADALAAARELGTTDEARAEVALLTAFLARASGDMDDRPATEALMLARATGTKEDLLIEAHTLVCELHRANGKIDVARAHLDHALALRDRIAAALTGEIRAAFLSMQYIVALSRLQVILSEPASSEEDIAPRSQRTVRAPSAPRELVGDDPAIRALLAAIKKVARSSSTVLVRGESGTGKELVADAIHRASDRATGPLVTVNCAALVETLLLSELFGHEKGSFTGAVARRRGRFELAEGGTLFLDEIGDISARTQVALLRVLQERTFERVGGTMPIRANVRIICATHRDLRAMVERGEFREDLYYRLRGITLELPPLRARMGDLPRIASNLLSRIALERNESVKTLATDAIDLLARHRWPGNVRELENALRAASLFADADVINAACLIENVEDLRGLAPASRDVRVSLMPPVTLASPPSFASLPSVAALSPPTGDLMDSPEDTDEAPLPSVEADATAIAYAQVRHGAVSLSDMKRQIERDCIGRALAETKGNITRAATLLGMKRPRLSQLVKQYGFAAISSEVS